MILVEKTKSGKARYIPINQRLFQEFFELKRSSGRNHYVFPNPKTGKPLTSVRTAFKAACRLAGITGIRLYDCRHTFASRLVEKGVDIETLRSLLGHSSIIMTQRYTHSNNQAKKTGVGHLDSENAYPGDKLMTKEIEEEPKRLRENPLTSFISWN